MEGNYPRYSLFLNEIVNPIDLYPHYLGTILSPAAI